MFYCVEIIGVLLISLITHQLNWWTTLSQKKSLRNHF